MTIRILCEAMAPKAKAKGKAKLQSSSGAATTPEAETTMRRKPCMWGMRFAVPLTAPNGGWRASMDDVRAMVQHVHKELKVQFPADDYFMNLLRGGQAGRKGTQGMGRERPSGPGRNPRVR